MTEALRLFFLLMVAHAVADFGLQSDWMAQNKRTSRIVRLMHSLIHGGAVYVVAPVFGPVEVVAHYVTDSIKSRGVRPSLLADQSIHVGTKAIYVLLTLAWVKP